MSYVIEAVVRGNTYIYECTSKRVDGKVTGKRKIIGKLDPVSGERIYKREYLDRMEAAGTPVEIPASVPTYSTRDLRDSTLRELGMFRILGSIFESTGLSECLRGALPEDWAEVYTLASYLVCTGGAFSGCSRWVSRTETVGAGSLSSQRISELTRSVQQGQRNDFFSRWRAKRLESERLALDITSTSSYSELVDEVEWGHDRDGDDLRRVNLCMLLGLKSRLPVYEAVYSGSVSDVSTLETTLSLLDGITGGADLTTVMDKGFFSNKNVNALLAGGTGFLVSVPFSSAFARNLVDAERATIDSVENTIVVGGDVMRAVTRKLAWGKGRELTAHVYFNSSKAVRRRDELYGEAVLLRDEALEDPQRHSKSKDHVKYLEIVKDEGENSGWSVTIKAEAIEKSLQTTGWLVS